MLVSERACTHAHNLPCGKCPPIPFSRLPSTSKKSSTLDDYTINEAMALGQRQEKLKLRETPSKGSGSCRAAGKVDDPADCCGEKEAGPRSAAGADGCRAAPKPSVTGDTARDRVCPEAAAADDDELR